MKKNTLRYLAALVIFACFASNAGAQQSSSTSNASLQIPTPSSEATTSTSSNLSTGHSYFGADLGLTYSWYAGGSNFFWYGSDPVNNVHTYLRFDNLGTGIGALIGLKGALSLSNSVDLEGKLRYITNYTSSQEFQPLPDASQAGAPVDVSNSYTLLLANLDLAAIFHIALSNQFYAAAGISYSGLLTNTYTADQKLPTGFFYNDINGNETNSVEEVRAPSPLTNTFSPTRFDIQLGGGSVFPISDSYLLDAELLLSIPLSQWIEPSAQTTLNADADAFTARYDAEGFPITIAHPTFPKLWSVSLTIGIRFPFGNNAASPTETIPEPSELHSNIGSDGKVALTGRVTDGKTGKPIDDATMTVVDLTNNQVVATDKTDGDGKYSVRVLAPGKYSVTADANGYLFGTAYFEVDAQGRILSKHPDIKLGEASGRTRLLVFFDFGSSNLSSSSYPELDRTVRLMKAVPTMQVEIAGYTDNVGAADFNVGLSEKRANAVRDYMVSKGIAKSRIQTKGYGMDSPIADNSTEDGRAENRRVEFVVLKK